MSDAISNEIAIIGMAGRFPGASSLDVFWQNIRDGIESIAFFSDQELQAAGVTAEQWQRPGYVRAYGSLEDIDLFDAAFFGLSPREAEILDPQQRLFLECAWEALESAAYNTELYEGPIGIYAGAGSGDYLAYLRSNPALVDMLGLHQVMLGNEKDFLATRVAYKLNLRGSAITVQTACSTSLVAVHLACQSLLNEEIDMALAGGVSINIPQKAGYMYQEGGLHSPDGHCRAFDAEAQGTIGGSGVGVVVLKRLEDALADRDCIHAIIKSSAVNNDGSMKIGYMAPSSKGQAEVIASALAFAQVDPETIGYIEAHGTGTPKGDPIEMAALTQVFRGRTSQQQLCAIGSVKTNIGHLDAAAGVAGLIKTVLALKHRELPPSLHFHKPNPEIDFAHSPFYVNTLLREWQAPLPRRAGVSAFGMGGTNCHLILEEAPTSLPTKPLRPYQLLMLSAKSQAALETMSEHVSAHLGQTPNLELADVCYTYQVGRRNFAYRRFAVCQDTADAIKILQTRDPRQLRSACQRAENPGLVFLFPGQGSQSIHMASELYQVEPGFRKIVDQCSFLLQPHLGKDIREILYPAAQYSEYARQLLNQTRFAQPALFVIEYALAQLWMEWGIYPQAMLGHSIGEYVAACLAGVFSLADALQLVAIRGKMMQALPPGAMLAVPLSQEDAAQLLEHEPELALAAVNGPELCTLSGSLEAVTRVEDLLSRRKIASRRLSTSHAFHSPMMEPMMEPFARYCGQIKLQAPKIPYLSNVTGTWISEEEATDPGYWSRHLRSTVHFMAGVRQLSQESLDLLLEVGPGHTLETTIKKQINQTSQRVYTSLPAGKPAASEHMLYTLGKLWLAGRDVHGSGVYRHEARRRVPLPTYPFERQRYWLELPSAHGISPAEEAARADAQPVMGPPALEEKPAPVHERPSCSSPYVAPDGSIEQMLATLWQDILGIKQVGALDSFFDLGGHSLAAAQFIARLREMSLPEIPLQSIFETPTIRQIAALVEQALLEKLEGLSEEEAEQLMASSFQQA